MRILFVMPKLHLPQAVGGAQWSTHNFCKGLNSLGDETSLLCPLGPKGWLTLKNQVKRKLTGRIVEKDCSLGYPVFRGWDILSGLRQTVKSFTPDVIVVVGANPGPVVVAREALLLNLPVLFMTMDVTFNSEEGYPNSLSGIRFTANSLFTMKTLVDEYGVSVDAVIYPPVDPVRCQVARTGNKVVVVNSAVSKGGLVALQIAQRLRHIPFVFYEGWGVNNEISEIKRHARSCPNIEWRPTELAPKKIFEDARLLLMPSQSPEAWGRAASEAHVSGIPVLGSDIGGLTQAIGPGGIVLKPTSAITAWCDAIEAIWRNDEKWLQLSIAARKYSIRKEIQLDVQVDTLRKTLLDLVHSKTYGSQLDIYSVQP